MTVQSNAPRPSSPKRSASSKQAKSDSFYGHEDTAKMCGRFITALFSCPDVPPPPANGPPPSTPPPALAPFIAYALHRTRLNSSVTFCALFLLSRLKGRFPAARGSSGHRLFISAFMIASKVICDDTYSNKSWCVVGQGMFSLREINQMEREMCSYLEWVLNVKPEELAEFESEVKRDYGSGAIKSSAPSTVPAAVPVAAPIRSTVSAAPQPTIPAPVVVRPASAMPGYSPDSTPPSPSHSESSSPASSGPRTPPTPDNVGPTVRSSVSMRNKPSAVAPQSTIAVPLPSQKASSVAPTVHVKVAEERIPGRNQAFAFASAAEW